MSYTYKNYDPFGTKTYPNLGPKYDPASFHEVPAWATHLVTAPGVQFKGYCRSLAAAEALAAKVSKTYAPGQYGRKRRVKVAAEVTPLTTHTEG